MAKDETKLLELLGGKKSPTAEEFKSLISAIETHQVLAKVFLLEGTPFVFESSPMKYVIFREQVAERFGVGSQDVCIVGSAKLGFSVSPIKFGVPFKDTSDVDVVVISEPLFHHGSRELFQALNQLPPTVHAIRQSFESKGDKKDAPIVKLEDWKDVKEALRNYVYNNFNPGLLPDAHPLRQEIFSKISSTAGLFLALEPKVFVSRIRCRIFRTWKSAEDYYANSLRQLKFALGGNLDEVDTLDDQDQTAKDNAS